MQTPRRVMTIGLLFAASLLLDACDNGSGSDHPIVTNSGAEPAGASATLSWDPSLDPSVQGYKVYYRMASGTFQSPLDAGLNNTVTISNLQSGTTYIFAITAYNSAGESAHSIELSAMIP
jgi:hypothetical protein